jgi:hypothetical protein
MPRKTKQAPPTEAYYRTLGYVTVKVRLLAEAADALAYLVDSTGLGKTDVISAALVAYRKKIRNREPKG